MKQTVKNTQFSTVDVSNEPLHTDLRTLSEQRWHCALISNPHIPQVQGKHNPNFNKWCEERSWAGDTDSPADLQTPRLPVTVGFIFTVELQGIIIITVIILGITQGNNHHRQGAL